MPWQAAAAMQEQGHAWLQAEPASWAGRARCPPLSQVPHSLRPAQHHTLALVPQLGLCSYAATHPAGIGQGNWMTTCRAWGEPASWSSAYSSRSLSPSPSAHTAIHQRAA